MTYNSESRNEKVEVKDMHRVHIQNALLKHLSNAYLPFRVEIEMQKVYIEKTKIEIDRLQREVKQSRGVARLLMDIITAGPPQLPREEFNRLLSSYRKTAHALISLHNVVSADDVRKSIALLGQKVNGAILSHVFRSKDFKQAGYRRSLWVGANGRYINTWTAA